MKDLYSFHVDLGQLDSFYEEVCRAYMRIFKRCGLGDRVVRTFASGGIFSRFSDEFQLLADTGEDTIFVAEGCELAVNKEIVHDKEALKAVFGTDEPKLIEHKAIEVGNTFKLGTRYTDAFNIGVQNADGVRSRVSMCSYGIGTTRLMGAIAEVSNDEQGIIWPTSVAPYDVHVVVLSSGSASDALMGKVREIFERERVSALIDDRCDIRAGEKFADADLLGMPKRVVVGTAAIESGALEVKDRRSEKVLRVSLEQLAASLRS